MCRSNYYHSLSPFYKITKVNLPVLNYPKLPFYLIVKHTKQFLECLNTVCQVDSLPFRQDINQCMSLHKPGDNLHNFLGQGTVLAFLVTQHNAISPLLLGTAIKLAKSTFTMLHRKCPPLATCHQCNSKTPFHVFLCSAISKAGNATKPMC